jgi:hypothetical protein
MQFFFRLAVALIAISWLGAVVALTAIIAFMVYRHRHSTDQPLQR